MKSIRVKNLKSISDSGVIDIKPITFLLGRNGSGKSSLMRLFPLLRQSIESRIRGNILWYGDYVDYGNFVDAKNKASKSDTITLGFQFYIENAGFFRHKLKVNSNIGVDFEFSHDVKDGKTFVSRIQIGIDGNCILICIDRSGGIIDFSVNNINMLEAVGEFVVLNKNNYIPMICTKVIYDTMIKKSPRFFRFFTERFDIEFKKSMIASIKPYFSPQTRDKTIEKVFLQLDAVKYNDFLTQLRTSKIGGVVWQRYVNTAPDDCSELRYLYSLYLASILNEITVYIDAMITEMSKKSSYIAPIRATAKRFYRAQELAVDSIDYQGQNLAMFLRSLTDKERHSFKEWTLSNMGFEVRAKHSSGHIELTVIEEGGLNEFNLADMGFGYSQILPIMAQLWVLINRKSDSFFEQGLIPQVFCMEQPELHLHPNHQAKVANMLVNAVKASKSAGQDIRLVVETHSEDIINVIGGHVYSRNISPDDVNVVVFEKKDSNSDAVVTFSSYLSDGALNDWPYGFFQPM